MRDCERRLATIRKISKITAIEGADNILLAHVDGWQCVVGKDAQLVAGQQVVYFEIDSALPYNDDRYAFLKDRCGKVWKNNDGTVVDSCIRIKTARFRGQISQGLVMSITDFPELDGISDKPDLYDVTERLGVRHFDELSEQMNIILGKAHIAGDARGTFPSYIVPRTDEERLQNLPEYFTSMKDTYFECTEKYDGSSMTAIYSPSNREEDPFYVCSRRLELKETEDNIFWTVAHKYNLRDLLKQHYEATGEEIALQGELVGPGMNANRDGYKEHQFRVFRIYRIKSADSNKVGWLCPYERHDFCTKYNLLHVRVIKTDWRVFADFTKMEDFLEFVQGKTEQGHEREGMVWKSDDGTISFKVINNNYLLKEK